MAFLSLDPCRRLNVQLDRQQCAILMSVDMEGNQVYNSAGHG